LGYILMMCGWIRKVNPSTWCVKWTAYFFVLCPWNSSHASWRDKPAKSVTQKSKNWQIRTRNPSKRAVAAPCHKPRGHRGRLWQKYLSKIIVLVCDALFINC
jgi:hypothetical protein